MTKAKIRVRELTLMVLPIVLLAVFGLWMQTKTHRHSSDDSGVYRTEVISSSQLPLTAYECWLGYGVRVRFQAVDNGLPNVPAGVLLVGKRILVGHMFLVGIKNGHKVRLPTSSIDYVSSNVRGSTDPLHEIIDFYRNRAARPELQIGYLADTARFPVGEVRLEGEIVASQGTNNLPFVAPIPSGLWMPRNNPRWIDAKAQPTHVSLVIRKAGEVSAPPDVRAPRFLKATVHHSSQDELLPTDEYDTYLQINWDVSSVPVADPVMSISHQYDPHIEDEQGKVVDLFDQHGKRSKIWVASDMYDATGAHFSQDRLLLGHVPLSRGKLTFKTWCSYRDSWPTLVSFVVRERAGKTALNR